ncbi:PucR family transcriptional regulator ligand-binding domain-containing protein [Pseudomonas qingdaonensis]|nr:PucR family transcriptional regulator ligand-binding domain-containing protein [Pseudomonas qingdaonensis]
MPSAYVENLAAAGLAGMMIGENMQAPANLEALMERADALDFAVMFTHYGVPFAAVTRAIVDAGQQEEQARRNAITWVYESARMSIQGWAWAHCSSAWKRTCRRA